jgi:hypothetical protein
MKMKYLGLVLVLFWLQSCTVTKRYHSFGFNVEWNGGGSQHATNERVKVDRFDSRGGKSIKSSEVVPTEVVNSFVIGPQRYHDNKFTSDTVVQVNDSVKVDSISPQETAALAKMAKLKKRIAKRWGMTVAIVFGTTALSFTADAIAHTELSFVGLKYLYLKIRYNHKFKKKETRKS